MTEQITLALPGEMKYLHLVSRFGARIADTMSQPQGANGNAVFSNTIELALSEAFTNSVKHKSCQQGESKVIITFEVGENELTVIIKDSNPRFDMEGVSTPVLADYPDNGYGVLLLKRIMDSLTYCRKKGWNVITMAKKLTIN